MNANDYVAKLRRHNSALFRAERINIIVESFEDELIKAFNAGNSNGKVEAEKEKSLWEKMIGKTGF